MKYRKAIMEYEKTRQLVGTLEKKRNKLIAGCTKVDQTDIDFKICLRMAFKETEEWCRDNNEYYTFSEVLEEGHSEGKYCDNCMDAYRMKFGELAEARKNFGNAKRKLACLGKSLLKQPDQFL